MYTASMLRLHSLWRGWGLLSLLCLGKLNSLNKYNFDAASTSYIVSMTSVCFTAWTRNVAAINVAVVHVARAYQSTGDLVSSVQHLH
jgi:hypothetical protein